MVHRLIASLSTLFESIPSSGENPFKQRIDSSHGYISAWRPKNKSSARRKTALMEHSRFWNRMPMFHEYEPQQTSFCLFFRLLWWNMSRHVSFFIFVPALVVSDHESLNCDHEFDSTTLTASFSSSVGTGARLPRLVCRVSIHVS